MATVQEALAGYRRKIEEIRLIQDEAEEARENMRARSTEDAQTEALAEIAARLAAATCSGLEEAAVVFDALVRDNKHLNEQIDQLRSRGAGAAPSPATDDYEDDDADDHFFGTHLREAWAILRRK